MNLPPVLALINRSSTEALKRCPARKDTGKIRNEQ